MPTNNVKCTTIQFTYYGDKKVSAVIAPQTIQFNVGFACSGGLGTQYDHGMLFGLDGDDHPQYHNDERGDARYDGIGSADAVQTNLNYHIDDVSNPHQVTLAQIGADPAGSAQAVQDNLDLHEVAVNPHNITPEMIGAAPAGGGSSHDPVTLVGAGGYLVLVGQEITQNQLTEADISDLGSYELADPDIQLHIAATDNPHGVTYTQVGADPSGSALAVQQDLNIHKDDHGNPHQVTVTQVGADPVGSADIVQGNLDTHIADSDAHPQYVLKTGDTMTGDLSITNAGELFITDGVDFTAEYVKNGIKVWALDPDSGLIPVIGFGYHITSGSYGVVWSAPSGSAILATEYSGYLKVQEVNFHKDAESITMPYSYPNGVPSRLLNDGDGNLFFEQIAVEHRDECTDTRYIDLPLVGSLVEVITCTITGDMPTPTVSFSALITNNTNNRDDTVYAQFLKNGVETGDPVATSISRGTSQTLYWTSDNNSALLIGDIISVEMWHGDDSADTNVEGNSTPTTITIQQGSSGGGTGGTDDHRALNFRDTADQHPISAITGLQTELDSKSPTAHTHTLASITNSGSMAAVDDAISDGNQYARQDGGWVIVSGGGSIPEAPEDGNIYGRQDAGWTDIAGQYIPLTGTTTPVSGTVDFAGSMQNGLRIVLDTADTLTTDTKGIYSQVTANATYHANAGRFDLYNESNFSGANTAVYAHARHLSALAGASTFALHGESRHLAAGGGSFAVTGEALSDQATGGTVYGMKIQAAIGAGSNPDQTDKGVQHDNAIGLYFHGSANTIWVGDTPTTSNNAGPAWTHAGILYSDISLANDVPAIQFGLYPDGSPHQLHLDNSRTYIRANTDGDIEFYVNNVLVSTIDENGSGGGSQWDDITGGINYPSGDVGIGTTTPEALLHVSGDAIVGTNEIFSNSGNGEIAIGLSGTGDRYADLSLYSDNSGGPTLLLERASGADGNSLFQHIGSGEVEFTANTGGSFSFWTQTNRRLTILNNGNVGIGVSIPGVGLDVAGGVNITSADFLSQLKIVRNSGAGNPGILFENGITGKQGSVFFANDVTYGNMFCVDPVGGSASNILRLTEAGNLGINFASVTERLSVGGNIFATGTISSSGACCTSDAKLKHNVESIWDAEDILETIRGVRFRWNKDDRPDMGVIAQELEVFAPELVTEKDDIKRVNYNGIVALLVEANNKQAKQIDDLTKRLEKLEGFI